MIKVFIYPYKPDKYAKPELLLGSAGDDYFAFVNNPTEADFLYSPIDLGQILWDSGAEGVRNFVYSLPHYPGNEERHFFHDYSACSDDWGLPSILFRAVKSKHDPNPLTISVPHTVDDFVPRQQAFSTLPYDVCFVGRWIAHETRRVAVEAVENDSSIRSLIIKRETFWGYIERDDPERAKIERMEFINAMRMSKMVLSPRGVELDAYRTWEAMSTARVPIWIGDDYARPFWNVVDYGEFMFQFPESYAPIINRRIKWILNTYTDAQLQARGERAREVWLEWFSKEAVPKTYAHYLEKFL